MESTLHHFEQRCKWAAHDGIVCCKRLDMDFVNMLKEAIKSFGIPENYDIQPLWKECLSIARLTAQGYGYPALV